MVTLGMGLVMKNMLFRSILKNSDIEYPNEDLPCFDVATLGPSGTSSEHAARTLLGKFANTVKLFPSFEDAANWVLDPRPGRLLLVPNAYASINYFYISNEFTPLCCFFCETPPYVLASRSSAFPVGNKVQITSHPAPSHLIDDLMPSSEFEVMPVSSTSEAAGRVAESEYELCLTTLPACEKFDLHILGFATTSIDMLWTLFAKRNRH